ncbi:MAG: hypothetical protein KI792_13135 [Alphaproteobacteria bacterium]|nr:hypothetical protein [Alphaproteobacteria bacterium SS10]
MMNSAPENPRLAAARATLSLEDEVVAERLRALDQIATENVRAGKGGPFAAELLIHDVTENDLITLAGPSGNAVLSKGIASAHAEAETLTPEAADKALDYLRAHRSHELHLIQLSSAESCPACRAKQMVFMYDLHARGWPTDGVLQVAFGASYEETAEIAGFNDKPYHDDMAREGGPQMISLQRCAMDELPDIVRDAVPHDQPFAAVLDPQPNGELALCVCDEPTGDDPLLTMEVQALQASAMMRQAEGYDEPWNLGKDGPAILLTTAHEPGALMMTDGQWAGISTILFINEPPRTPPETRAMGNFELMKLAGAAYNVEGSPLRVRHMATGTFDLTNQAQHVWRDEIVSSDPTRLYNGLDQRAEHAG